MLGLVGRSQRTGLAVSDRAVVAGEAHDGGVQMPLVLEGHPVRNTLLGPSHGEVVLKHVNLGDLHGSLSPVDPGRPRNLSVARALFPFQH